MQKGENYSTGTGSLGKRLFLLTKAPSKSVLTPIFPQTAVLCQNIRHHHSKKIPNKLENPFSSILTVQLNLGATHTSHKH